MTEIEPRSVIEALIFAADKPILLKEIKEVLDGEIKNEAIIKIIDNLKEEHAAQGRSFYIVEVAGGFRMATRPQFGKYLKKFYGIRHRERLSRAALETLSIVAYKQPVIRVEVEAVRGVDAAGVLHSLLEKRLIRVMGRREIAGRPLIYGTTDYFLEHFGLNSLSGLPRLEEFKEGLKEKPDVSLPETDVSAPEKPEVSFPEMAPVTIEKKDVSLPETETALLAPEKEVKEDEHKRITTEN